MSFSTRKRDCSLVAPVIFEDETATPALAQHRSSKFASIATTGSNEQSPLMSRPTPMAGLLHAETRDLLRDKNERPRIRPLLRLMRYPGNAALHDIVGAPTGKENLSSKEDRVRFDRICNKSAAAPDKGMSKGDASELVAQLDSPERITLITESHPFSGQAAKGMEAAADRAVVHAFEALLL